MKATVYVSANGEVLSNREHPVSNRLLLVPEAEGALKMSCEAVSELALEQLRIRHKVYKAVTIDLPDDFLKPEDGLLR